MEIDTPPLTEPIDPLGPDSEYNIPDDAVAQDEELEDLPEGFIPESYYRSEASLPIKMEESTDSYLPLSLDNDSGPSLEVIKFFYIIYILKA